MGLAPPKLRDLNLFMQETDSQAGESLEVWEIGVPPRNSLYWSIVLSYLLPSRTVEYLDALNKLTGFDSETTAPGSRRRSSSTSIDYKTIYKRLRNFNPFKNRYVSFFDEKMIEVLITFKLKLNQYANESKSSDDKWDDELKLNTAARMLNCKIDICMPEESGIRYVLYPKRDRKSLKSKITLFQYRDQKHGCRKENINVFYFAMSTEQAFNLKISALSFILKKAKLSACEVKYLKRLMNDPKSHGKNFLRTVLQSPYCDLMKYFYKSPYIALKLSEADFETNPIATNTEQPSAFLLAFSKANTMYIRILYDYASNCRYLFTRSVRDADETILDTLKLIHDIFDKVRDEVESLQCGNSGKERAIRRQSEFSRFNEYQQNIVSKITELKNELNLESQNTVLVHLRKKVIECILTNYLKFFYYNSQKMTNLQDIYYNYLSYSEYYENLDCFSCLSFFDNIHLLKKLFQMQNEDIYANIESTFFLTIVSNKFFPKFNHSTKCNNEHDEMDCERKRNVLRLIPLLYREKLKSEILIFQGKLQNCDNSLVPQDKIKENDFRSSLASLPEIRDELLICRIQKYLSAAIHVSFEEDGIKGIFVIERALQVLGESIKPQTTEGCIVSSMLGSRIPTTLKKKLINIRDDLSHYKDNSVLGRMATENDEKLFQDLQEELRKILEAFEIVAFTQYLRLEEYLLEKSQTEVETQLKNQDIIKRYQEEKQKRFHDRNKSYERYYNHCITLSLSIINELRDYLHENYGLKARKCNKSDINHIVGKLKAIEYVFLLMSKLINKDYFETFLSEIKLCREKYEDNTKKVEALRYDVECFRKKYIESINVTFHIENFENVENTLSQYPKLEGFLACLKKCYFDKNNVKEIIQIIKISYDEAVEAQKDLNNFLMCGSFDFTDKEELLIKKLIITPDSLKKLRKYLKDKNLKMASKELNKQWITKESLVDKLEKLFQDNSIEHVETKTLLIKIAYQNQLPKIIFKSPKLTEEICAHIKNILTKKVEFLLSRIQAIKSILIDENDEIRQAWKWGRSNGIKYHMKFLMRQRFLREMSVRASLEMAFFDCLNILQRQQFQDLNEKLNNLFTGINLRNVISHGHSVLETIGGLLDEDDFPSELIKKMLDLVADSEVITIMQQLIPCSGTLEKDIFISWIENNEEEAFSQKMKIIKSCPRWTSYLYLLPLI